MNVDEKTIKESITYLNQNKKEFLETYTKSIESSENRVAIFTAGMSGVGKTELATFLKEENPKLLHIDTDKIREFLATSDRVEVNEECLSIGEYELYIYTLEPCSHFDFDFDDME